MFFWYWFGEKTDGPRGETSDAEQKNTKVKIVYATNDRRSLVQVT